jgi:hypothetical protein
MSSWLGLQVENHIGWTFAQFPSPSCCSKRISDYDHIQTCLFFGYIIPEIVDKTNDIV